MTTGNSLKYYDQLKEHIKHKKNIIDITWPEERPMLAPTCKMRTCAHDGKVCVRRTKCNVGTHSYGNKANGACYETNRYPSLCDRILYVYKKDSIILSHNDVRVLEFGAIKESDHNAVYANIKLRQRMIAGSKAKKATASSCK